MKPFEVLILISFNAALIAGTIALIGLRRQIAEVGRSQRAIMGVLREQPGGELQLGSDPSEIHPALISGEKIPDHLRVTAPEPDRWSLSIGVKPNCQSCAEVLEGLAEYLPALSRLTITLLVPKKLEGLSTPIQQTVTEDKYLEGAPFALLVDPSGVIQGNANLQRAADLADFVSEGEGHGFGPGLEPIGLARSQ